MRTRTVGSGLWLLLMVVGLLATPVFAKASSQDTDNSNASAKESSGKKQKPSRWEGVITRSNKDKKTLTVRQRSTGAEKDVMYDDSTQWTSQEHASKKVNHIDASQVSDNDRVICLGHYDKKGILHATLISKRLTQ